MDAARTEAVGLQTVRDWGLAFNAAGPAGLIDLKGPSQKPKLDATQRQVLVQAIEEGLDPERHGVVLWRLKDLVAWVYVSFGVSQDESTLGRVVRQMGFAKLSARPRV